MFRHVLIAILAVITFDITESIQPWQKRGCYKDNSNRALDGAIMASISRMSNKKCIQFCFSKGYILAATQFGKRCFCGNLYKYHIQAKSSTCNMKCNGNPKQFCGGSYRNSVFLTGRIKKSWYLGCYKDFSNRALDGAVIPDDERMTNTKCIRHCRRNNFLFAATQYRKWCFCGNVYKYHKRAKESTCKMRCSGNALEKCGGGYRNSLYFTGIGPPPPPPVNGGWTTWDDWGRCSKTCGGGLRSRKRSCDYPQPSNGGKDCDGNDSEKKECNQNPCPVDGGWTTWDDWGRCSKTCGGGLQNRKRSCENPRSSNGGNDCEGGDSETKECNKNPCPVDGGWTEWSDGSECSKTCGGGLQSRKRSCENPRPSNGGKDCDGGDSETKECNKNPCPVDGGWTTWDDWGRCSKTCGGGLKSRKRSCDYPQPSNGGKDCDGNDSEKKECNKNPCHERKSKGRWVTWSQWTKCTKTCGSGTQIRERKCEFPGSCKLKRIPCSGRRTEARLCVNDEPCLGIQQWKYVGYNEDSRRRALTGFMANNRGRMTIGLCIRTCGRKGFKYAGMQAGKHCFCGNSYKYPTRVDQNSWMLWKSDNDLRGPLKKVSIFLR